MRKLSEGVAKIAAAFYPSPLSCACRTSKRTSTRSSFGGSAFEPVEDNPMLGFRGASRYTHPPYADGFALECAAMKRVRDEMGLRNVMLMIPFCRRRRRASASSIAWPSSACGAAKTVCTIYVMCEIPNNVIQIDAFAKSFDGFSIGSNDLTQFVLGVDRDSELVAFDFDERDDGVREMLRLAVEGAKRNGRYVGICGQAPSDYPEIAEYLVRLGIDSIGLNPDSVIATIGSLGRKQCRMHQNLVLRCRSLAPMRTAVVAHYRYARSAAPSPQPRPA